MSGDIIECWNCGETYSTNAHERCPICDEDPRGEAEPEMNYDEL